MKDIPCDSETGTLCSLGSDRHLGRLALVPSAAKIRRLRCLSLPRLKRLPLSGIAGLAGLGKAFHAPHRRARGLGKARR